LLVAAIPIGVSKCWEYCVFPDGTVAEPAKRDCLSATSYTKIDQLPPPVLWRTAVNPLVCEIPTVLTDGVGVGVAAVLGVDIGVGVGVGVGPTPGVDEGDGVGTAAASVT
jgi:hypothetical protein